MHPAFSRWPDLLVNRAPHYGGYIAEIHAGSRPDSK